MNPELLKLFNAINAKKEEVKKFCAEDRLDEAEVAKEELKQMQNKFNLMYDLFNDEEEQHRNEIEDGKGKTASEPENKKDSVKAFTNVLKAVVNGHENATSVQKGNYVRTARYNEVQEEYDTDSIEDSPVANIQNNWKSILLVLQTEYNIQDIQMSTWIKPLRVENVEDNILNLSFRNPDDNEQEHNTNVKYVQKRFAELLSNAIAEYMDAQYVVKIK